MQKDDYPNEDELVLCTVTSVQFHSVFCKLDEYGKSGLIHISEVAPGRIRNIREFVEDGKKVVCKVLRVNKEKGHIDLSLRRVNEAQKRQKLNAVKQEQLVGKILEHVAKTTTEKIESLRNNLIEKTSEKYQSIFAVFEAVAKGELKLDSVMPKKIAEVLTAVIQQRIKPPEARISGEITISTTASDGIEKVKMLLAKPEGTTVYPIIKYLGAGKYLMSVTSEDYKKAEKIMKTAVDHILDEAKKNKITAEYERVEK